MENFKARQGIKKGKLTGAGTDVQRARALGWGVLAVANEPTFKPEEMAWPPPPLERVEPIEAGPGPVPEPVPLLVRAEGGQTQEVYVMPKVKMSRGQTQTTWMKRNAWPMHCASSQTRE